MGWFVLQPMLPLKPRLMLLSCMEDMAMVLVWAMLDLAMVPVWAMLVLAMVLDLAMVLVLAMVLLPPLLPDTVSPMLPSVRLRLSQRLKLMLLFSMEDMAMVVWDMLDLDMAVVLAMLVLDTMARGLLMLSLRPRLMLLFS